MLGWEIWGVKASLLLGTMVAALVAVLIRLMAHDREKMAHVDGMAGDEGED